MPTFNIIKSKAFTTKDKKRGVHYSVAYKGRVFGLNTLRFEGEDKDFLIVDSTAKTITTGKVELRVTESTDPLTNKVSKFVDVVPINDLPIGI